MVKVIIISAFAYILIGIIVYYSHPYLLFQNVALPADHDYDINENFTEIWADDTQKFHGLLFKKEKPKGVILYFHGNRGNLERWAYLTENLRTSDYDLLLVEFPSFGKSQAKLTQANLWKTADLFMAYALQHYPQKEIIIYGRSMGTGIASWLSAKYPVKHLILETPYTSLQSLIGKFIFFLPYKYLIKFNFEPEAYLNDTKNSVLIFHGTNDLVIPVQMARKLATVSPDKTDYIEIEGGTHDDLSTFEQYRTALNEIIPESTQTQSLE